jgi:SAM-dependent methyltransferase
MTPAHYQTLEKRHVERMFAEWAAARRGGAPLRVLDFGCGRGKFLHALRGLGCLPVGVDANPAYVAEARAAGFEAHHASDWQQAVGGGFDVVFLSHLIEHLTPEALFDLVPRLVAALGTNGRLVIITPVAGERFWHDATHVRPYYPQSIRHAFGQADSPVSFGNSTLINLVDIHFFRDPFRTRTWRSFYFGAPRPKEATRLLNAGFDALWRWSGGRIGATASWLGVYEKVTA